MVVAMLFGIAAVLHAAPVDEAFQAAARHYEARSWQEAADAFTAAARAADETGDKQRGATARFYAGEALVQLGQYDQGRRRLEEFLDEAPGHRAAKTALFRIGECLLLAGDAQAAIARLEQFRTTYPSDELNALVLAYLGDMNLRAGKPDEALARYEQGLREFPAGPMAAQCGFGVGRASESLNKLDDAVAAYRQFAEAGGPLADDATLHLAIVQQRQGDHQAAVATLATFDADHRDSPLRAHAHDWRGQAQLASENAAEAAASLRAAIAALGEEQAGAMHHLALADALRQAGEPAEADASYRRVLDRWPDADEADDALYGRLVIAEQEQNTKHAESLASELVRRFPNSPHLAAVQLTQARLLVMRQDYAAAEPILTALVAADGANRDQGRYLLGLALLSQGKHEAALTAIEAIETPSAELAAPVREVRAATLMGLARYEDAVPLLEQLLADAPDESGKNRWRTHLIVAHYKLGDLDAAAGQLDQLPVGALEQADAASAALAVAELAYRAGNHALAKKWFTALAQDPADPAVRTSALAGLAWTQLAVDGPAESAATFERVLRDYSDSPLAAEAAMMRGQALAQQGEHNAALAAYRLVIDKHTESPQLPAALLAAGRLYDSLDQDHEAAELLARLVSDFPDFAQRDTAIYALGWALADQEKHDEAQAQFAKLTDDFPASPYWADATYRLAQHAARQKDHARAAELADRIIAAQCPAEIHEHALYLRGQSAAALGQWNDVTQQMEKLLEEHAATKFRPQAEFWLAEADFRQNEFARAREKFERLADAEDLDQRWALQVPLRIVQCLVQERRWAEAIERAEAAIADEANDGQRHEFDYLIGRALASQGKLADARAAYERARAAPHAAGSETAAAAQWLIGEAFFHQKNYAAALAAYQRCSGHSGHPRWQAAGLLQAGKCRLLLGQTQLAIADFQKLADELGDTPYAAEARQRLAALTADASSQGNTSRSSSNRTQ
jgi:TolA-binding protein